ncbi:hypothetical protein P3X46_032475 [Hevea brasiliensis]|uniref:Uncharacterized protein n=2 Tax=Hevea brasiliensis TaxID=3981 RepID=A0ABQ9KEJ9_HEVBR|nr:hypothetical protein P3X46_032475 [Hevea brasiliensis]
MENKKEDKTATNDEPAEEVINYSGIKAMPYIIGNETFEKLGTVGSYTNLVVYLTTVFNMKSVTATTFLNLFNGTASIATLAGAFLSDTYFGRYKSLAFASVASFLGMLVLMLTAAISNLHPPNCAPGESSKCVGPTAWQFAFLLSAFGFLVIGAGGIRPCNLAFGADQFNPNTESGKKGISSFFNWYYLTYTFAVMVSVTVIVFVQSDVSWAIGLAIPAFLMFLSCVLFFLGTKIYVIVKPQGSPLTSVAQVLVASVKKRGLKLPENPAFALFNYFPPKFTNSKLPHTSQFRFLDKAAIITSENEINSDGSATDPWRLCSIQQVEEVKCWVRVVPIWASAITFNIPMIQQQTYVVLQALQLDRSLGTGGFKVPAATYIIFTMLTLTIWIPIYDRILVPYLRNLTGKEGGFTLLQRMGIGIVLSILCMLVSGLVEEHRKKLAFTRPAVGIAPKGGSISSMSSLWLVPQLALAGLAEGFCYVAQTEFYYKQFPENMRSIAQSFFFANFAVSSYLSGFLVSIVHHITSGTKTGDWLAEDLNKGKLDYFYYMICGMGILNFVYFLVCAKWYKYRGAEDDTEEKEPLKHRA